MFEANAEYRVLLDGEHHEGVAVDERTLRVSYSTMTWPAPRAPIGTLARRALTMSDDDFARATVEVL
jgi:hypothetical protein